MKKLYTKLAGSDLKFSRFSFVKVLSLATAATFLSNVTPVFSANPDFRNTFLEGVKSAGVSYLQSILSVAGLNNSEDYANFLTKTLTGVSDYSPIVNVLPEASDSIRSIDMNAGSKKITRADLTPRVVKGDQITSKQDLGNPLVYGERAQGEAHDAIVFGQVAQTKADQGIAIGLTALAGSSRNTKNSIAIGSSLTDSSDEKERTVSFGDFSIAFGSKAHSYANEAIAMGYNAYAKERAPQGVAIGARSNVTVAGGVALGSDSISDRAAGEFGYTSLLQGPATNIEAQWKSTRGSVSVGDYSKGITRQITGVAAGSNITDAVNLRQLQDLEKVVRQNGWKLSVGDKNATTVLMNSGVDFSAGSSNLNITKGGDDNNIKFDLAKDIALESVKIGKNTFDATGLVIADGPKITTGGIDAGNKKVTGVTSGDLSTSSTDAVNGSQIHTITEDLSKILGGNVSFDGKNFKVPEYKLSNIDEKGVVTDKPHSDVGSAFKGLDENIKNVNARIKEISEGVAQDSLSWSVDEKAFVALHGEGDDRKASKITSLAAGSIVSGSSDAVNGGQIYDLNQSLAKYFGGDAKYDGDGWVLPGFKIMTFQEDGSFVEEDYDSIAAAFSGVNKVFKNLHNEISDNIEQNALLWSDDAGAFVAQHEEEGKKENSKITFLAKGKISEDSTDAINGGQIYTLQQTFASYFGGGSGYDKEGNWQGPKFYVQVFNKDGTKGDKEERNSVSEAFDVVNDSMSNINDRIKEVEKDTSSNSLNWNKEKGSYDASHVDSQGVKSPSKIINVANGKVDRDSKEAVNGGQLWETQQMITDQVKDIENKVTEGSVQYDKDKKTGKKTNKVTLVGVDDSSPVLIDNVADGKIKKDSKEAVNGGQLKDKMDFVLESANKYTDEQISHLVKDGVSGANSYTDMKVSTLSYVVEDVRKEARQAAAVGLAVSSLRYSDIPGKLTIAFGSGLWRSQSAFAFGTGYTSENGYIGSNLSITTSGGHWGISAGVNVILN
ncbi:YadA-like family protein [Bartonella sp. AC62GZZY]|uniref:YadA-like family protein n=1 Tax=Bartonella sp. AC62GZZY TaxID=3243457 RepID=UPI0038579972